MGTNYYMRYKSKTCECCNRTDEEVHIGKSSYGWTFSFRGYRERCNNPIIKSVKDWAEILEDEDTLIVNEYQETVSKDEFWKMIYSKENEKYNHALLYPNGNWIDDLMNSFSGSDFS